MTFQDKPGEDSVNHLFAIEDLYLHQKISDIACNPARPLAACSVTSIDRKKDNYVSHLWRFALDGSSGLQITQGTGSDNSPHWSPDGNRLAFISDHGGSPQVHVLPADGGEARQLSRLPQSVSDLGWMPSGDAIVITAAVVDDPDNHSLSGGVQDAGSGNTEGLEATSKLGELRAGILPPACRPLGPT